MPIEVVMAQVGHVSAEMTRYYTHLSSRAKQMAVAAVQRKGVEALVALGLEEKAKDVQGTCQVNLGGTRRPKEILTEGDASDE